MKSDPEEIQQRLYDSLTFFQVRGVVPENVPVIKADYEALKRYQGRDPVILGVPIVRTPDPSGVRESHQSNPRSSSANRICDPERCKTKLAFDEFFEGGGI
jgi:hypothetical protein